MGLRKVGNKYSPYSNCVTLKGQLSNWTSKDIVEVATKNIETIIEPIRGELAREGLWNDIGSSEGGSQAYSGQGDEFGSIGDNVENVDNANSVNNEVEQNEDYGYVCCDV